MSEKLQGEYLKSLTTDCIKYYEADQRPQSSIKNLRNFLGRFLEWIEDRELTPKECRSYIKYMQNKGLAWSSVASDTRRLKSFLTWLYSEANDGDGIIDRQWAKEVHSPRKYGEKYNPQEMLLAPKKLEKYVLQVTEPGPNDHKLHREVKAEHRAFLLFYMKMGLRPSEAINIKPENVNLDGDPPSVLVWRGKSDKWQPLGLPLDYLEPIRERVEQGRWFNVNLKRLQKYMRDVSKLSGKKVVLYSIRKSVDTFAIDAGAPLMKLAVHQGHNVKTMQDSYVKFSAKHSSEVNNTYNPWIDRSRLPSKYLLPRIEKLVEELERHDAIRVERGQKTVTISW